jgi:hypothetical protein
MHNQKCRQNLVFVVLLAAAAFVAQANGGITGQLWYGGQGSILGTAYNISDDRVGYINSDLSYSNIVEATNVGFMCVGVDPAASLYFGFCSDGSLRSGTVNGGQLQQIQILDNSQGDVAYAFTVDTLNHLIYLGLWGNDSTGADLIKIPYNPTNGAMSSPYDAGAGMITNKAGVLLSEQSTSYNFVLPHQMWVTPDGTQIYYVDNDNADPDGDAGTQLNGVYVVNTTVNNPQPTLLSNPLQFSTNDTGGYIVGLAVNQAQGLIYFATDAGNSPGSLIGTNAIWCMPISGLTTNNFATNMPMPAGVSLVYPNFAGGCLAWDTNAQALYVSDEGQGTIMQLSLSSNGTSFTSGTTNFYTLDPDHLHDGANGYPSAYVQGIVFEPPVQAIAPVTLSIALQGTNVVVSWPSSVSGFTLQYKPFLATNSWSTYPGPFGTNANTSTISATNILGGSQGYFRLSY